RLGWLRLLRRLARSFPARDHHARTAERPGLDRELVAETLRSAQPQTESRSRAVAVAQRELHVGDPRPLILERQAHAAPHASRRDFYRHLPASTVIRRVAGQLTRGSHDFRLLHEAEPRLYRAGAHLPAHVHDVVRRAYRQDAGAALLRLAADHHPPSPHPRRPAPRGCA